ncbi:DUF29 domain-containing protein [Methylobacterium sp. E-025]|uniref:DUF29 domain-containing protein n=1 Tax=unclassified Methylobacterium TaxID=2615210 RepID=UPI001FB96F70|nr:MULTISPECIES: DUF29 domain-containing protein [unclassified Methylobacterium]MCJ2077412.1 DUF29 domain-containing protein [Methylobacterium sp. E-016]MCJ2113908.1 DUF29 domain-containing protein [Methylobacterium sp. E-025]
MSNAALRPPPAADPYETDFYLWTQAQAELLRARRFDELDLRNLIDEVRSVGASEKREIGNRLAVLLGHLLKWKYQPGARKNGWMSTIVEQRTQIADIMTASPSLKRHPASVFTRCYLSGRLLASKETGIDFTLFPEVPPFTVVQALDLDYLPKEPDLLDQS